MCNFGPNSLEKFINTTLDKSSLVTLNFDHNVKKSHLIFGHLDSRVQTSDIWVRGRVWSKCPIYNPNKVQVWSFYPNIQFVQIQIEPEFEFLPPLIKKLNKHKAFT